MAMRACRECRAEVAVGAPTCPHCGVKNPAPRTLLERRGLLGCLGVLLVVVIAVQLAPDPSPSDRPAPVATPRRRTMPEIALDSVALTDYSWTLGGFGGVMMGTFKITNRNSHGIKDIAISCTMSAPSGTTLQRIDKVIYDVVEAGKTRTFREVNMGFVNSQATAADCQIHGLRIP